jgi:hypothetical protein
MEPSVIKAAVVKSPNLEKLRKIMPRKLNGGPGKTGTRQPIIPRIINTIPNISNR